MQTYADNRFLFLEFCRSQELLVANTWYKQPPGRQVTYSAPGTQHLPPDNSNWDPDKFAQLDFILVPRRWRNACRNVFSQPRANLDSDHFPVVALMQYKLSVRKRQPKPRHFQFRGATASQLTAMNQEIDQALDATNPLASDPTRQWQTLSAVYIQALDRHIPTQHNAPRHPWITNHTLQLIERRGLLRTQGCMDLVADLNKQIKRAAKADKRAWLNTQLETGDWRPITNLNKPFPQRVLRLSNHGSGEEQVQANNAEIYANHLATNQWREAGELEGIPISNFTDHF